MTCLIRDDFLRPSVACRRLQGLSFLPHFDNALLKRKFRALVGELIRWQSGFSISFVRKQVPQTTLWGKRSAAPYGGGVSERVPRRVLGNGDVCRVALLPWHGTLRGDGPIRPQGVG